MILESPGTAEMQTMAWSCNVTKIRAFGVQTRAGCPCFPSSRLDSVSESRLQAFPAGGTNISLLLDVSMSCIQACPCILAT